MYNAELNTTSKKKKKVEVGNLEHQPDLKRTYSHIYVYIGLYKNTVS